MLAPSLVDPLQMADSPEGRLAAFIEVAQGWFADRDMVVHFDRDFRQFQRTLDRLDYDRYEHRNPVFDPRFNRIDPDTGHFITIENSLTGATIAVVAGRLAPAAASMTELFVGGKFLFGRGLRPAEFHVRQLSSQPDRIAGDIAFGGNAFVIPALRNKTAPAHLRGISTMLVTLCRATMLQRFNPDWYVILIKQALSDRRLDVTAYRHQRRAELWFSMLDENFYGLAERQAEVLEGLASVASALPGATSREIITKPEMRRPSLLTGQMPPR